MKKKITLCLKQSQFEVISPTNRSLLQFVVNQICEPSTEQQARWLVCGECCYLNKGVM